MIDQREFDPSALSRQIEIQLADLNWNAARATIDRAEREYHSASNQKPPTEAEKLKLPITYLDIAVRTANSLQKKGISSIGDLLGRTKGQLAGIENVGTTAICEIFTALDAMGFQSKSPARTCPECGKKIANLNTTRKFCGRPCYMQSMSNRPASTRVNGTNGR